MGFSAYSIEKKQVSTDRGVTWQDVDPSETRQGQLLGVYRTLLQCEDRDCPLEEYRYEVYEVNKENEYCNEKFPYGILKKVTFTEGGMICGVETLHSGGCRITWDSNHATVKPASLMNVNGGASYTYEVSTYRSWHTVDGACRAELIYKSLDVNGDGLETAKVFNCCNCCDLDTCFTVDEYMPWVGDRLKRIIKKHYVKNRCSDEWQEDETYTPQDMGFGERWIKTFENVYKVTWQHQLAIMTDDNTVLWEDEGLPFDVYYDDTDIPEDVEIIDYIMADGVATAKSDWANNPYYMEVMVDPTNLGSPSGYLARKEVNVSTYVNWCHWSIDGDNVVRSNYGCDGNQLYPNEWGFANICYNTSNSWLLSTAFDNILNHVKVGKLIYRDGTKIIYPYKIPSLNGWDDPYYNASEYGYIDRFGNKIVLEYVCGKYTDSSGVTHNLVKRPDGNLNIPDDVVSIEYADSVTSISNECGGKTGLTSVTLNNVATIGNDAFRGCTSLTSIDLGKVSGIGSYAFAGCTSLSSVSFSTSANTSIGQGAFEGCSAITNVALTSVSRINSYAFNGCTSLSSATFNEGLGLISNYAFNGTKLSSIVLPTTAGLGWGAFRGISTLEDVTIQNSNRIEAYAFKDCNIKTLTFTVGTPPPIMQDYYLSDTFSFAANPITFVPCEYVDAYKTTYPYYPNPNPIPNEYRWVDNGYVCIDGMRTKQYKQQGRDSGCTDDEWYDIPDVYSYDEPIGECLYEELYYIERDSSHNGVITDLGVTLKDNTRFEIKLKPTNNGGGMIVGEVNAPSDNDDYRFFWYGDSIYYDYGSSRNNVGLSINNTYELEVGNYYIKYLNGSDIIRDTAKSGVATAHTRTMGMFGSGDYAEIYYLKVYEGDAQVKNFIPVRREDGLVTLYDTIGHTFCNVENGTFRASDE